MSIKPAIPHWNSRHLIREVEICGFLLAGCLVPLAWFYLEPRSVLFLLLGFLLATLNLRWMIGGIDRALDSTSSRSTRSAIPLFLLRLVLITLCLYVTIRASFMGFFACLAGFSVYIGGAMVVSVKLAFLALRRQAKSLGK